MKSVYLRILVWFLGTLTLSMIGFVVISRYISFRSAGGRVQGHEIDAMMLEEAKQAYESGGAPKLAERMKQLHKHIPGEHYLTDPSGRDLATSEDRSSLLSWLGSEWEAPKRLQGRFMVGTSSPDGRYRLITVLPVPFEIWPYMSYYLLILLAVGMVCWALALSIASPLRSLSRAVDRFGQGDLSVRINSRRRDEIGALGKAFDRMAERIERLLAFERRLLQDISHELCAPLARLSFAVELVRRDDIREASILRLKKEINRLRDLVSVLLEMARAEENPSSCNLEKIRLDDMLTDVVKDCCFEARERGCRINFEGDRCIDMFGNKELLHRAFENILRNAIRYTPEGSAVDVRFKAGMGNAYIVVRDYGPGVPENMLSKIFEPFFRVDDSRNGLNGNVGLGLSIARRAIDLHHGQLIAEMADPGLILRVELPIESVPVD